MFTLRLWIGWISPFPFHLFGSSETVIISVFLAIRPSFCEVPLREALDNIHCRVVMHTRVRHFQSLGQWNCFCHLPRCVRTFTPPPPWLTKLYVCYWKIWNQLRHPNNLPKLGQASATDMYCVVVPRFLLYYRNGDASVGFLFINLQTCFRAYVLLWLISILCDVCAIYIVMVSAFFVKGHSHESMKSKHIEAHLYSRISAPICLLTCA